MPSDDRKQRREAVIAVLNEARSMELQAIHQYMNQHYSLDDADYGEFAAQVKLIAIDEMRHAEMFAERVKELGGEPVTDPYGGVEKGQSVEEVFAHNAEAEDDAVDTYNRFQGVCRESGDSISVDLFGVVIDEEQAHYNYFDSVNEHIQKLGAAYLAQKAGTSSATGLDTQGFVARSGG